MSIGVYTYAYLLRCSSNPWLFWGLYMMVTYLIVYTLELCDGAFHACYALAQGLGWLDWRQLEAHTLIFRGCNENTVLVEGRWQVTYSKTYRGDDDSKYIASFSKGLERFERAKVLWLLFPSVESRGCALLMVIQIGVELRILIAASPAKIDVEGTVILQIFYCSWGVWESF